MKISITIIIEYQYGRIIWFPQFNHLGQIEYKVMPYFYCCSFWCLLMLSMVFDENNNFLGGNFALDFKI